jgi:predicted 3-demethylubiquinone-9 3-methyltransferase (glyoxalase superfamily)
MNKISPFLWLDANAEDAANFYLSIFPKGRKLNELRATEAGPGPAGSLVVIRHPAAMRSMMTMKSSTLRRLSKPDRCRRRLNPRAAMRKKAVDQVYWLML